MRTQSITTTTTRRKLIASAAAAAPLAASAAAASRKTESKPSAEVYSRIGVKPIINGMGTVTVLGGSLMAPEVIQAMNEAARHFVQLPDLQRKVGARIAELLKVPAAMVTCGAASGIAIAAAACISRGNPQRHEQMPDTAGIPHEVIQQKAHRSGYEHQMRIQGAKIVWVETAEDVARAVSDQTAMMFFLNKNDPDGKIKWQEWVALAKKHNVPSFNDAAADVPPKENLWKYVQGGFDLVAFSGGKGLRGPQASGLLLGRKDLIDAAHTCMSPAGGVGRGMKVGKEEMIGVLAALELFLQTDHDAVARELDRRIDDMKATLGKVQGLELSREIPGIANAVPHLRIRWDESRLGRNAQTVLQQLREGDPAIHLLGGGGAGNLMVSVWMMKGLEHKLVAQRLAAALSSGKA